MTDWANPTVDSNYLTLITDLRNRDFDAGSLFLNTPTGGLVAGMIRYVRASNKFQEYDGAVWNDKVISLAGGGTGAATAVDARTNLGLGSIATQLANNVLITGGSISGNGAGLTNLDANNIASGIIALARLPSIPWANVLKAGSSLLDLATRSAADLASGILPDARFPATLPALNGSNLTNLNGAAIATGQIPVARMGTGAPSADTFLRGDGTWAGAGMRSVQLVDAVINLSVATGNIAITALTSYLKAFISMATIVGAAGSPGTLALKITSNTNVQWDVVNASGADTAYKLRFYVIESY